MSDDTPATILIVDDDPLVRRTIERALVHAHYDVHTASSGTEAIQKLQRGLTPALLISDVMMDDMIGPELVAKVRVSHPEVQFVLMSGETLDDLPGLGVSREKIPFLPKPFRPTDLLDIVADLLNV